MHHVAYIRGSSLCRDDCPFGNKSIRTLALIYNRLHKGSDSKLVKNWWLKPYPEPSSCTIFPSTGPKSSMHESDKRNLAAEPEMFPRGGDG